MNKILDSALKAFAETGAPDESRSVIVELAATSYTPPRSQEVPPRRSPERKKAVRAKPDPLTMHGDLLDELGEQIAAVVSGKVVRLDSAEAFVVNVNPAQLRAIAGSGLVGAVRPNVRRR